MCGAFSVEQAQKPRTTRRLEGNQSAGSIPAKWRAICQAQDGLGFVGIVHLPQAFQQQRCLNGQSDH
jgi:hypothetical protein